MVGSSLAESSVLEYVLVAKQRCGNIGGYLATHGVYTASQDYKDKVVRHLIVSCSLPLKGPRNVKLISNLAGTKTSAVLQGSP